MDSFQRPHSLKGLRVHETGATPVGSLEWDVGGVERGVRSFQGDVEAGRIRLLTRRLRASDTSPARRSERAATHPSPIATASSLFDACPAPKAADREALPVARSIRSRERASLTAGNGTLPGRANPCQPSDRRGWLTTPSANHQCLPPGVKTPLPTGNVPPTAGRESQPREERLGPVAMTHCHPAARH